MSDFVRSISVVIFFLESHLEKTEDGRFSGEAICIRKNMCVAVRTDVIVDAIAVDDKPTKRYKGRRFSLIFGIVIIVAVAISVLATLFILGERNNEPSVVKSATPSPFGSSTPTRAPSLSLLSSPSKMPTEAPALSHSPRILKALYNSTDGPN